MRISLSRQTKIDQLDNNEIPTSSEGFIYGKTNVGDKLYFKAFNGNEFEVNVGSGTSGAFWEVYNDNNYATVETSLNMSNTDPTLLNRNVIIGTSHDVGDTLSVANPFTMEDNFVGGEGNIIEGELFYSLFFGRNINFNHRGSSNFNSIVASNEIEIRGDDYDNIGIIGCNNITTEVGNSMNNSVLLGGAEINIISGTTSHISVIGSENLDIGESSKIFDAGSINTAYGNGVSMCGAINSSGVTFNGATNSTAIGRTESPTNSGHTMNYTTFITFLNLQQTETKPSNPEIGTVIYFDDGTTEELQVYKSGGWTTIA